uniref:L-type lectin-domain containing receptor kinase S.4 n=1 Tax=Anthurium amnicola TaxID=1678845 RepID=A0A1D1YTI4_9ARAE
MGMGVSFLFGCSLLFSFCLVLSFGGSARDLAGEAAFSFSFPTFEKKPGSESEIALYGDAEVVNSTVRITSPRPLSRGRVVYRKPLAFGRKPSFSTYFSFSISPAKGDGLAFLMAPSNVRPELLDAHLFGLSAGVFAVEFDTSMDSEYNDPNENHVGVDLSTAVSVITGNVSKLNLALNAGEKLQTWIDYDGDSKTLEVRLCKSEFSRPSEPVISYPIDLSGLIWKNAMSVGIASSSGHSTQTTTLYAWNFSLEHAAAYLIHSEPLDPRSFLNPPEQPVVHLRRDYLPGVLIGLVVGAACGAIVVILVLFAWTAFVDRRPIAPVEYSVHPVEHGYEKMVITGHKAPDATGKI